MRLVLSQALGMSWWAKPSALREPALGSPWTKPLPEHPESWGQGEEGGGLLQGEVH